jgi:cell division protein FtsA
MVYNIDKTAQCLQNIVRQLELKLRRKVTQVYVGVGGQSIRSVRNNVTLELPQDTKVTLEMVDGMADTNRAMRYPDMAVQDVAVQEYRVDSQLQLDPVGIQAMHLEGNYLNILQRVTFFKNLNDCFKTANLRIADFLIAPLALAKSVLTETERRSGCALVDMGAETTTVSVFTKNILRHLVVIPLGAANITRTLPRCRWRKPMPRR